MPMEPAVLEELPPIFAAFSTPKTVAPFSAALMYAPMPEAPRPTTTTS